MVSRCPGCDKPAVSWKSKLLGHSLACQHCGLVLRRNLLYLGLVTALYLMILVQTIINVGMTGLGMVLVLLLTLFYILLSLYMPFKQGPGSIE